MNLNLFSKTSFPMSVSDDTRLDDAVSFFENSFCCPHSMTGEEKFLSSTPGPVPNEKILIFIKNGVYPLTTLYNSVYLYE